MTHTSDKHVTDEELEDVYKRQVHNQFRIFLPDVCETVRLPHRKPVRKTARNADGAESVSYTHLDVYKRQIVTDLIK